MAKSDRPSQTTEKTAPAEFAATETLPEAPVTAPAAEEPVLAEAPVPDDVLAALLLDDKSAPAASAPEVVPAASPPATSAWTGADATDLSARLRVAAAARGPHTVLSPMMRHGEELAPGAHVEFEPEEHEHVAELVLAGSLFPGVGPAADAAVAAAEKARAAARAAA